MTPMPTHILCLHDKSTAARPSGGPPPPRPQIVLGSWPRGHPSRTQNKTRTFNICRLLQGGLHGYKALFGFRHAAPAAVAPGWDGSPCRGFPPREATIRCAPPSVTAYSGSTPDFRIWCLYLSKSFSPHLFWWTKVSSPDEHLEGAAHPTSHRLGQRLFDLGLVVFTQRNQFQCHLHFQFIPHDSKRWHWLEWPATVDWYRTNQGRQSLTRQGGQNRNEVSSKITPLLLFPEKLNSGRPSRRRPGSSLQRTRSGPLCPGAMTTTGGFLWNKYVYSHNYEATKSVSLLMPRLREKKPTTPLIRKTILKHIFKFINTQIILNMKMLEMSWRTWQK
jgi:hypothetical protein